jgi:glycosyltransferase involved in cell wall biosynthesis
VIAERRLVTIGHSYVVAENRRLAHEMAVAGAGRWRVHAIAPASFRADLRRIALEPLANEACAVTPLSMMLDRSPHFMCYRGLRDALAASRADVVHCWEEPFVLAGAQVARAAPASARVVYATFQNIPKAYPWPLSAFERTSMQRAAGWIAFGESGRDTLSARDGYTTPHRVIPPGVDLDRFRPDPAAGAAMRRRLGWTDDAHVVGYLGRFESQKGLEDLMSALARLHTPWHALFVGGGSLQPELDAFAKTHQRRVAVIGGVGHGEVPAWLNAMSVLCAPSRTTPRWREQFGRMLIEAMACGVPTIASDSGEMPAVIAGAGLVLPEGDPGAWATALDALLEDRPALAELARKGRARAMSAFAWPVVARRHLDFFDDLLEGRAR